MATQSEQLERQAGTTRTRLAGTLDELRLRLTPGQVVDQVADYVRDGPASEFLRNLAREMRENPMPVLVIAVGIAWLVIASARRPRMTTIVETETRVTAVAEIAPEIPPRADEWREQRTDALTPLGA